MEAFSGPDCLHTWQKFHATAEQVSAAIRIAEAHFHSDKVDLGTIGCSLPGEVFQERKVKNLRQRASPEPVNDAAR